MTIREQLEEREGQLHPKASRSILSSRRRKEKKCPVRTEFQRDRDRIIHCKSFRRLKHKTQVFIAPEGDHFRTRLTHTLEVSQIARTIARALNLNEDLTEAIALGHDLGHTPFGHMGEKALNEFTKGGFKHSEQSLRVAQKLEYNGKGLNLTQEVMDGIARHSKGMGAIIPNDKSKIPESLEGQIVRISDIIAYVNHDIDDALRAKIITINHIPESTSHTLGSTFAKRIDTIVIDVIHESLHENLDYIAISDKIYHEIMVLRDFLFDRVYWRRESEKDRLRIEKILSSIYKNVKKNPQPFIHPYPADDPVETRIVDFIAGMTDNYAMNLFISDSFK